MCVSLLVLSQVLIDKATQANTIQLLKDLRTISNHIRPSRTGIPDLDELWKQHGGKLSVIGRGFPLVYSMISHMVKELEGTVVVVDLDGRFSPSHLVGMGLWMGDLRHVHVFRCSKERLKITLDSVEDYMLWGEHGSKGREWLGTIVLGGVGGDVMVGWRGWLGVEREVVGGFGEGVSVEEAWTDRERRKEIVDNKGWRGVCEMGEFRWG
jgi:hypothetical protein